MDELNYKKKYIKYKTKYLNLLSKTKIYGGDENDDPNKLKPVSTTKINPWTRPNPLLKKSTLDTTSIETPSSSVLITPTKSKSSKDIADELTPSKAVNKKELCYIFNDDVILQICSDNNFIGVFVDKPKIHQGDDDECLLELWTKLDPSSASDPILIGHITVHKGVSISRSKTFHFRSDYITDFLIVITLTRNETGKIFIVGENNKHGTVGFDYLKSLPGYVHNLGGRIENIVMKILEYLNTITSQILLDS